MKKPECAARKGGDEWPIGVWGVSPRLKWAFSLKEARFRGMGSMTDIQDFRYFMAGVIKP